MPVIVAGLMILGLLWGAFGLALAIIVAILFLLVFLVVRHRSKINAMTPEQLSEHFYGQVNVALVCPHCQTTGKVRQTRATVTKETVGTIGGIAKSNVNTTTFETKTQNHCDHCGSTWFF